MKQELRARLADSTNTMVLRNFEGCEGKFYVKDGMAFIDNEHARDAYTTVHRTSLVLDYEIKGGQLIVKTLNSVYKYDMLQGPAEAFAAEFEALETASAGEIIDERKEKHQAYMAQGMDGWLGPVVLPEPMDWDDATTYIRKHPTPINEFATAYRLIKPIEPEKVADEG